MFLLSLLLLLIFSVYYICALLGGHVAYYIDPPSMLLLFLITIPVLMSAGLFKDFNNAFRFSARRKPDCSRRELERAIEAVRLTIKTLWAGSVLNVTIALIYAFILNAQNTETLLPYLSVSIIPLLYASFFVILLLPMQSRLKLRLDELSDQTESNQSKSEQLSDQPETVPSEAEPKS